MRNAAMKKIAILLVFATLLFGQCGAYAQGALDAMHSGMSPLAHENNEYDNLWTAVQISLLIAVFYLLYWLKEGAFD
jgi:hypothetical protein